MDEVVVFESREDYDNIAIPRNKINEIREVIITDKDRYVKVNGISVGGNFKDILKILYPDKIDGTFPHSNIINISDYIETKQ